MAAYCYFVGAKVPPEEVVPPGATLRRADHFALEADASTVYIGPPDPDADADPSMPTARAHWAHVKAEYEASDVRATIEIIDDLDPLDGAESGLDEVVGTRQANALREAGYGTLAAARALPKEQFVDLDGVGESSYDKLHD